MIRREQPAQLAQALMGILNAVKQKQQRNEFQGAMQGSDMTGNEDGRMRVLAQMLGLGNPYANQYLQGQKAIQSLQPEVDFMNTPAGVARTTKTGGFGIMPGTEPPKKTPEISDKERGIGDWIDEKGNYVYGPYRPGLKPYQKPTQPKPVKPESDTPDRKFATKLSDEMVSLGNQIAAIDSGTYMLPGTDKPLDKKTPQAQALIAGFRRQIANKQRQLNSLQKRKGWGVTMPNELTISLQDARAQYGDQAKDWTDDELKKFLTSQGWFVK